MEHFPRFRRKKDNAVTVRTTNLFANHDTSTTAPLNAMPNTSFMNRTSRRLSPLRVFHRSSGKRGRETSPAHLPQAAATVNVGNDGSNEHPVTPESLAEGISAAGTLPATPASKAPKIPAFLQSSPLEINNKFHEILWRERERLASARTNPSPDYKWAHVVGGYHKTLDRYQNIQPWHNNRVKLQVPEGQIDYINASPIVLAPLPFIPNREPSRFIAMQGPKSITTDHVWRMVIEQLESPGVIVMLTETHEGAFEKCYSYFPRNPSDPPLWINERDEFGDGFRAIVSCEAIEDTSAGEAIELRKLVIRVLAQRTVTGTMEPTSDANGKSAGGGGVTETTKLKRPISNEQRAIQAEREPGEGDNQSDWITSPLVAKAFENPQDAVRGDNDSDAASIESNFSESEVINERIVWHFLYKKWPDFGVPGLDDLDSFFKLMRLSREKNAGPHNPRVVHCSAGVGRSGTFIALEHLIAELEAGLLDNFDELMDSGSSATSPPSGAGVGDTAAVGYQRWTRQDDRDLIFTIVNRLREQRRTMVQAESQYMFIYQVLRKLWWEKYGQEGDMGEPAAKRLEYDPFGP